MLPYTRFIRPTIRISLRPVSIASLLLASSIAAADPPDPLDRINLGVGAYFVNPSADLRINDQYGNVDSGNITSHSVTVPRAQAEFLIGDSQGISIDYYGFYRRYSDSPGPIVLSRGQQP